jgi:hypothetical protein
MQSQENLKKYMEERYATLLKRIVNFCYVYVVRETTSILKCGLVGIQNSFAAYRRYI